MGHRVVSDLIIPQFTQLSYLQCGTLDNEATLIGFYCFCYFIVDGNIELYHANQLLLSSVESSVISSGNVLLAVQEKAHN